MDWQDAHTSLAADDSGRVRVVDLLAHLNGQLVAVDRHPQLIVDASTASRSAAWTLSPDDGSGWGNGVAVPVNTTSRWLVWTRHGGTLGQVSGRWA